MKVKHTSYFLLWLCLLVGVRVVAQDTLPRFTAKTYGDQKFLISWKNPYKDVTQISIQRSFDSLKNFRTVGSITDPTLPQNGFADFKSPFSKPFYRILIVFTEGRYLYTKSKRAFWDTVKVKSIVPEEEQLAMPTPQDLQALTPASIQRPIKQPQQERILIEQPALPFVDEGKAKQVKISVGATNPSINVTSVEIQKPFSDPAKIAPPPPPKKIFQIKRNDSLLFQVHELQLPAFKDSMIRKTRDTIVFRLNDTIVIKPFVPKEIYVVSQYVFVNKEGHIEISIGSATNKTYALYFFEENGQSLFQLKKILEPHWILDKSYFLRSGWYRFELYEDGKLKEKNKLYIPKEF